MHGNKWAAMFCLFLFCLGVFFLFFFYIKVLIKTDLCRCRSAVHGQMFVGQFDEGSLTEMITSSIKIRMCLRGGWWWCCKPRCDWFRPEAHHVYLLTAHTSTVWWAEQLRVQPDRSWKNTEQAHLLQLSAACSTSCPLNNELRLRPCSE